MISMDDFLTTQVSREKAWLPEGLPMGWFSVIFRNVSPGYQGLPGILMVFTNSPSHSFLCDCTRLYGTLTRDLTIMSG